MQVVYIESVLLDNFVLDLLVLLAAARLAGIRIRIWRALLAAALGAAYAVLSAMALVMSWPVHLAVLTAMCAVAYSPSHFGAFARYWGMALAAAALLAGAVLAATGAGGAAEDGAVRLSHLRCIGAGAACGMLCIELLVRRHIPQRNTRYKIAAEVAGEIAVFYARLDTGNRLTDHGGNGVIIADKKIVLSQLSSALCRIIEEGKPEKGVAMRPFFCMGAASQGKLDGVYAKTIHLTSESGERYVAKGYIALGEDIRFDGCDALLSDKMTINRVRGNHHVSNP